MDRPVSSSTTRPAGLAILAALLVAGYLIGTQPASVAADPNRQRVSPIFLPVLDFIGSDDVCQTWIDIQNLGSDPAVAALLSFGEPGFCPPQSAGFMRSDCSALIAPGRTWRQLGAGIPRGARSGVILRFTARRLSDLGLSDDLGPDALVSDLMCDELYYGMGDDYHRMIKAYTEGLHYAGISQHLAAGEGRLAVQVTRDCPTPNEPHGALAAYTGIPALETSIYDPTRRGFELHWPLVSTGPKPPSAPDTPIQRSTVPTSILYAQNAGVECAWVELWTQSQGSCAGPRLCQGLNLAPGETAHFDLAACTGPDWHGNAWLHASQALAALADVSLSSSRATYPAIPAPFGHPAAASDRYFVPSSPRTWAPYLRVSPAGWDSAISVLNSSDRSSVRAQLDFLDPSGATRATLVDWICPRGSRSYTLSQVADIPSDWQGSLRLSAGPDRPQPSYPSSADPHLAATVSILRPGSQDPAHPSSSTTPLTYALQAADAAPIDEGSSHFPEFDDRDGAPPSPFPLLAIPRLESPSPTLPGAGLALLHASDAPGFVDLALYLYDANGLYEQLCPRLYARQQLHLDAPALGFLPAHFQGSALVSARYWEHEAPNAPDDPPTLLGLSIATGPAPAPPHRAPSQDALPPAWILPAHPLP
ncbi:MAG: hypothetical protein KDH92_05980, partial [Chloroflexi bacterium]|nr:hypothetical protein [Chloroflexota bacterium]